MPASSGTRRRATRRRRAGNRHRRVRLPDGNGGGRTRDLLDAIQTLSQLSYVPKVPGAGFEPTSPRFQRSALPTELSRQELRKEESQISRPGGSLSGRGPLCLRRAALPLIPDLRLHGPGGNRTRVREPIMLKRYVCSPSSVLSLPQSARALRGEPSTLRSPLRPSTRPSAARSPLFPSRPEIRLLEGRSAWLRRAGERRLCGLTTEQRHNVIVGN